MLERSARYANPSDLFATTNSSAIFRTLSKRGVCPALSHKFIPRPFDISVKIIVDSGSAASAVKKRYTNEPDPLIFQYAELSYHRQIDFAITRGKNHLGLVARQAKDKCADVIEKRDRVKVIKVLNRIIQQ
jgi:hypothetical protein